MPIRILAPPPPREKGGEGGRKTVEQTSLLLSGQAKRNKHCLSPTDRNRAPSPGQHCVADCAHQAVPGRADGLSTVHASSSEHSADQGRAGPIV